MKSCISSSSPFIYAFTVPVLPSGNIEVLPFVALGSNADSTVKSTAPPEAFTPLKFEALTALLFPLASSYIPLLLLTPTDPVPAIFIVP